MATNAKLIKLSKRVCTEIAANNGKTLKTSYKVSGNTITQTIDPNTAQYPITADPKYTWGLVTGTVYFNKAETRHVAYGGGVGSVLPNPYTQAVGAPSFAWAGLAIELNKCIKLKVTPLLATIGAPMFYSGGYCK